jgi:hypothetical protein
MQHQQGAALILFFLIILISGTIFVVSNVSMDDTKIENEEKTTQALAKAKEALLSYATTFHDTSSGGGEPRAGLMGFLPCPEIATSTTEGRSISSCGGGQYISAIGRLPWKTLGIEPLKDGSGSCLWYVVSSEYKNSGEGVLDPGALGTGLGAGYSRSEMLNDDSNGSFELYNRNGNLIKGNTADDRTVVTIIAPGKPLAGQVRTFDNTTHCGGDFNANQFLEVINGVDNRSVTAAVDTVDDFIASDRSNDDTFNDRIITISQQEIFGEIKKRTDFTTLMQNTTRELAECMAEFGKTNPGGGGGGGTPCDPNCESDCDSARSSCRFGCSITWLICRFSGERPNICAANRNTCRRACDATRDACYAACAACGGGGGNDYRLPWPAAMDLGGFDYRFSESYVEDNVNGIHLGRFPVDVSSTGSVAGTDNPGGTYLLENDYPPLDPLFTTYTHCTALNTDAAGTYNNIERRIWQNWKDHFFYALAGDYDPSPANNPSPAPGACTNCLTVDGNGPFSAVVIYSGERINNQVRDSTPDVDTKSILNNYLEGDNLDGDLIYETNATNPAVNDIAYCIDESMQVSNCQ